MGKTFWELVDENGDKSAMELECSVAKTVKMIDLIKKSGLASREISGDHYRKLMMEIELEEMAHGDEG